MTRRIVLADDHQVLREGLRGLLEQSEGMEVVGEAANGRDAVALARELAPDILLLDISMADMNGTEAAVKVVADCPQTRVIALSVHSDRRYVLGMLKAGARGYLVKSCAFEEIVAAVHAVHRGECYLCSAVTGVVVETARGPNEAQPDSQLSGREREVLQLLAEGMSTKGIAARLDVSTKTIDGHRAQIMQKLDLHSIAELTKYAIREGLTSLDN